MDSARYWIDRLGLQAHPEGGWYRETFRSPLRLPHTVLPTAFRGPRNAATAIYFLLEAGQLSHLHRIAGEEAWAFHAGDPLEVFYLTPEGELRTVGIGLAEGCEPQFQVPAGVWFGARSRGHFSLVSCWVAPGFDFADFELARAEELARQYPAHVAFIRTHSLQ
jgi:predicted cupin superfamily sugar epimerase